jgi:hypothetical protein
LDFSLDSVAGTLRLLMGRLHHIGVILSSRNYGRSDNSADRCFARSTTPPSRPRHGHACRWRR